MGEKKEYSICPLHSVLSSLKKVSLALYVNKLHYYQSFICRFSVEVYPPRDPCVYYSVHAGVNTDITYSIRYKLERPITTSDLAVFCGMLCRRFIMLTWKSKHMIRNTLTRQFFLRYCLPRKDQIEQPPKRRVNIKLGENT